MYCLKFDTHHPIGAEIITLTLADMILTWKEQTIEASEGSATIGCRSSHSSSVHNASLYTLGGEIIARTPVDSLLWKLPLTESSSWSVVETLSEAAPSPRIAHAQTVVHNELFIFGGRQGITMEESPLSDLWKFSFDSLEWVLIPPTSSDSSVPSPRSFHKMLSVDNTLYVFGGCAAQGRLNDLHAYDIATNAWTKLAAPPASLTGRGGAGFVTNGTTSLFVVGGFNGAESNGIWRFDIASNSWETVLEEGNTVVRPFSVACGATIGKHFLFFGGEVNPSEKGHEGAGGFTNDVVVLDSDTGLPVPPSQMTVVGPLPRERGWAGAGVFNDSLVVYGGLSGSDAAPQRLGDVWVCSLQESE